MLEVTGHQEDQDFDAGVLKEKCHLLVFQG